MADVESNINVNIDTSNALASIRRLQSEISAFHTSMAKGGAAAAATSAQLQQGLINSVNATGNFSASMTKVKSTTEAFTTSLEKNKFSLGEYFRYAGASTKTFGRLFQSEMATIDKVARERVKDLQTQYIKLGRDASGAMKAIAVRPLTLDLQDLGTKTAMAAQKQQLFNELMRQGSTNLLNFGKNTQWAGRQLMVGFSIPLGIAGAAAAKEFMKLEEQAVRFKRVYGDTFTPSGETDKMIEQVKQLAGAYTTYGIAVEKTMGLAADAAAMGKTGADLLAQIDSASKLAVLGGVDQQKALETTTSLTNAFNIATKDLAGSINFLNAVENQTVTSIDDLTTAIPTAAPVIKQLGGNVQDLAFFLTAMREGGINASEGANALKSGLASMINPTTAATEMLGKFGINLQGIVDKDKGNVKQMIVDLGLALDGLDPTNRAQAIEQLFGKFQFARMSTLFQNVIKEGSQAGRVLDLTRRSATELAILSEREMKKVSDSPMYKFQAALEKFQAALAPVGEAFLKLITPIIEWGKQLLDNFNGWSDSAKNFTMILIGAVAGLGPILLMGFGLIANGAANVIKGLMGLFNFFKRLGGQSKILGEQTKYMSQEQLNAMAAAASLEQAHAGLTQAFTSEAAAISQLIAAYEKATIAQSGFMSAPVGVGKKKGPVKKASGGIITGPGTGTSDSIPTMLSNGEAVIPAKQVAANRGLVEGLIAGNLPGFATGGIIGNVPGYAQGGIIPEFKDALRFLFDRKYSTWTRQKQFSRFSNPIDFFTSPMQQADRMRIASTNSAMELPLFEEIHRLRSSRMSKEEIIKTVSQDPRFKGLLGKSGAITGQMLGSTFDPKTGRPTGVTGTVGFARLKPETQLKELEKMRAGQNMFSTTGAKALANSPLMAPYRGIGSIVSMFSGFGSRLTTSTGLQKVLDSLRISKSTQAMIYSKLAVHRSDNPSLENNIMHPKNVPVDNGRLFGPGTYFAENPVESNTTFKSFGFNKYKMNLTQSNKDYIKKSKGYLTEEELLQYFIDNSNSIRSGSKGAITPRRNVGGGTIALNGIDWNDEIIQDLIGKGYLGYKHGDALTNWMVGTPGWGLKKVAAGGFIKGPGTGTSDSIPAMLSNGEAVIPAEAVRKNPGLINGLISGKIKGFVKGTPGDAAGKSAVVAFGAHQPFTIGHTALAEMGKTIADAVGSEFKQFTSAGSKESRSILSQTERSQLIEQSIGQVPGIAKNPFDLMEQLQKEGYTDIKMMLDEERAASEVWQKAGEKFGINVEKIGVARLEDGVSGTAARAAAASGDSASFRAMLAKGVSDETASKVMNALRVGQGLPSIPTTAQPGETTTQARKTITFPHEMVLEATHMSEALERGTSAEQQRLVLLQEQQRLLDSGVISEAMIRPQGMAAITEQTQLVSGRVPLLPKDINQRYTSEGATASAAFIMERLRASGGDIGAMLGSSDLAHDKVRAEAGLGTAISDEAMKQYFAHLEEIFSRDMDMLGDKQLTEPELQAAFQRASQEAINRQPEDVRRRLQAAADLGNAKIQVSAPSKGGSGRTDFESGVSAINSRGKKRVLKSRGETRAARQDVERVSGRALPYEEVVSRQFTGVTRSQAAEIDRMKFYERLSALREKDAVKAGEIIQQITTALKEKSIEGLRRASAELSSAGFPLAEQVGEEIADTTARSITKGAKKRGKVSSPAAEAVYVGEMHSEGFLEGAKSGASKVKSVGEAFANRNVNTNPAFGRVPQVSPVITPGMRQYVGEQIRRQMPGGAFSAAQIREMGIPKLSGDFSILTTNIKNMSKELELASPPTTMIKEAAKSAKTGLLTAANSIKDFSVNVATKFSNSVKNVAIATKEAAIGIANSAAQIAAAAGQSITGGMGKIGNFFKSGKGAGISMGASMGLMMAQGIEGPVGDIAGAVSGPLMLLSTLGPMLGSLPAPVIAVVVALGALAAVGIGLKMTFDNAQRAAEKFAKETGASADAIQKLSDVTGQVSATEEMSKRRADSTQYKKSEQTNAIVQGYSESEQGKATTAAIGEALAKGNTKAAITNLTSQMTTAIASGAINAVDAKAIVDNIGQQIGDNTFSLKANAEIEKIIGPNGQDLAKDPINVRLNILKESAQEISKTSKIASLTTFQQSQDTVQKNTGIKTTNATKLLKGDMGELSDQIWNLINPIGQITGNTMAMFDYMGQLGTVSGQFASNVTIAASQSQQMLDSLQIDYEKRIEIAKAAGDTAEAERLATEYRNGRKDIITQNAANSKTAQEEYAKSDGPMKTSVIGSLDQQIKDRYQEGPLKSAAQASIDKLGGSSGLGGTAEFTLKTEIAAGTLNPTALNSLLDLYKNEGKDASILADLVVKFSGADASRVMQFANMADNPTNTINFTSEMKELDPEAATQVLDTLDLIGKYGGEAALTVAVSGKVSNIKQLKADLDEVDKFFADGQQKVYTAKIMFGTTGFALTRSQAEYFNGLSPSDQKTYTTAYLTVFKSIDANTSAGQAELRDWANAHGGLSQYTKGRTVTSDDSLRLGRLPTIDYTAIAQAQAGQQAQDAVSASQAAAAAAASAAADAADFGGGGGGTQEAPRTIAEVIADQQKRIDSINNQTSAVRKLTAAGLSLADAYAIAANAEDAALIANGASAEQLADLTAKTRAAEQATKDFAAATSVAGQAMDTKEKNALAKKLASDASLTDIQKRYLLQNPDAARLYMTPLVDPDALKQALLDAQNASTYEFNINKVTIPGLQEIWKKGMSNASEAFSAQQNAIEIKFKFQKEPFKDIIDAGKRAVEDIQNRPGGLDDLDADLQRISDKEFAINKAYDDKVKALDEVSKINDRIISQQKSQLGLASALSTGDIAAAARAAQEMQAQSSSNLITDQKTALDEARKAELAGVTGTSGLTREQIEEKVRDLKAQILEIEEQRIEPAQRQMELLDRMQQDQIDALTVLGKTKDQWDAINTSLELANTNTQEFQESMRQALAIASELGTALANGSVPTVYTPPPAPAPAPAPAARVVNYAELARQVYRGDWGNGQDRVNRLMAAGYTRDEVYTIQDTVNRTYYASGGLVKYMNKGGKMSYMNAGGMTKYMTLGGISNMLPKGTDTIPAMLTAGEFVMSKPAVDKIGTGRLAELNRGYDKNTTSSSDSVYNYSISVNASTNANPNEIARTVIAQIKQVDAQRIRGNRF
jgi:TP901 family phage tail tape measure protein